MISNSESSKAYSERINFSTKQCLTNVQPGRGCSNTPNLDRGIGLHVFPSESDLRPEVQRRRKILVDFVKTRRAKWEPTANARLCSVHFEAECFQRRFTLIPSEGIAGRPTLIRDDFGVSAIPTIHTNYGDEPGPSEGLSQRAKRKVCTWINLCYKIVVGCV